MNEKLEHGGGRLPVVGGENHTPAVGDHTQYYTYVLKQSKSSSCSKYLLTVGEHLGFVFITAKNPGWIQLSWSASVAVRNRASRILYT